MKTNNNIYESSIIEKCKMAVLGCRRNPQAHEVEECIKCEFKNGMCDVYRVAEKIYEQNKDKVILTRKEHDDLLTAKDFNYGYYEGERNMEAYYESIKLPETCKKIAEKFAKLVEFHAVATVDENGNELFTISNLGLREILREEFGFTSDDLTKMWNE